MLKGVIFDMDGVLFDTERIGLKGWRQIMAKSGYPFDENLILRTNEISGIAKKKYFLEVYGPDFPYDKLRAEMKQYKTQQLQHEIPVKPGVVSLLGALKEHGILTAVATSNHRDIANDYMQRSGLFSYMDVILSQDVAKKGKPDPDVFLCAAKELGLPPTECMAVEDAPPGLMSAKRAGCITVMISDLIEASAQDITDRIFDSVDDLREFLERNEFCV